MDRNLRPRSQGDLTGRLFRENAIKAAAKKAAEEKEKNRERDYSQYLREAEQVALEEHSPNAIDFKEARTNG
jgi:hypothetical protein